MAALKRANVFVIDCVKSLGVCVCVITWPGSNKVQHGGTAAIKEMIVDEKKNEARKFNSLTQQRIKTEAPAAWKIRLAASPPQDDVFTFCQQIQFAPQPPRRAKAKALHCVCVLVSRNKIYCARDYNTRA